MEYHIRKTAFTLAEILITLGIIGVVAAITLPSVVQKIDDRQNIVKWKKAFSVISNAVESAVQEEALEQPFTTKLGSSDPEKSLVFSHEIYNETFKRLNTTDFCLKESLSDGKCPSAIYSPPCKSFNPSEDKLACMYAGGGGYAKLTDGTMVYAHHYIWASPAFTVDVNGSKGPNTVGRDIFLIVIRNQKAVPAGADEWEYKACDKNAVSDAGATGIDGIAGVDCSAKYLLEK